MAEYVILSKLTDEGRKTLKKKPERIMEVNKELEEMGVIVKQQYALLGNYDFLNIVEAPDNETVMRMSVELGSRGSVELLTLPALDIDAFVSMAARM
ncbi:GYD domain-containing protein [Desulfonatronospira sp.]|uniref:GYD domain-containing protein n=1 Tax=Desulfonatronospira sp. TaxID=1962951 RepID=UPI0025C5F4B5|nr:GYD domain-containing protein [Desulfonatronospira sp.]